MSKILVGVLLDGLNYGIGLVLCGRCEPLSDGMLVVDSTWWQRNMMESVEGARSLVQTLLNGLTVRGAKLVNPFTGQGEIRIAVAKGCKWRRVEHLVSVNSSLFNL
ncbi:hypothetical protein Nepgr_015059 [Nepenthes gracilis]|uniref:Uncharacterized protein n=1 Tax=Nepenthes gracilis TaxID=150966 RepID=A0AAD3SKM1_NEPGR|nr:hypothetical protein Nepgr_015059 [Nepenthes gracilis]